MAKDANYAMVAVITGLTRNQLVQMQSILTETKFKVAPVARGTISEGLHDNVFSLLQNSNKKLKTK